MRRPQLLNWLKQITSRTPALRGESRVCTVSFTNMTDYVGIAEAMPLADLPPFMSTYFEFQGRAISANGGTICNIVGDNIMACWDQPASAQLACESALVQCVAMKEFGSWAAAKGYQSPAFRIGINTGMMNVQRGPAPQDLRVLGDGVNLASRLDHLNKYYGTQILLSEFTREALNASLVTRPVDIVRVKGKEQPLRLFELFGRASDLNEDMRQFLSTFDAAFSGYQAADFAAALTGFQLAQELRPADVLAGVFVSRCTELLKFPPDHPWDGVLTFRVA